MFAVTAGADPIVLISNLSAGRGHGRGLSGHEDAITGVIMASLHGRPTIITGSKDRTSSRWTHPA